jgi:LuxR family maltose regulon positive regulatory protein
MAATSQERAGGVVDGDGRADSSGRLRLVPDRPEQQAMRGLGFMPSERVLQRPRLPSDVVARGELVDILREHADVPVVLVTASPGFGKTTLIAEWDDEDPRPFTWLTADATCNDPHVFVTYLTLALQRLGPADPGVISALADQSDLTGILLPRLGRLLSNLADPFVLVVDDAGHLTDPVALEVLSTVANHLQPGSQLVVSGRASPDLQWSLMQVERRLLTLGPDQLRLTPSEAAAVVESAGVDLPSNDLSVLLKRTEGWPAGVYLAALSLRRAAERRGSVTGFGGPGSVIAEYLRRDVLGRLPEEQRTFLVRTCILNRFTPGLCDAVLGRQDSAAVLSELEHRNVFVVPLDRAGEWYRYHYLFRDMLLVELNHVDRSLVAQLHARASDWLEQADDIPAAIEHAAAARSVERAAGLIWSQTGPYLASGRAGALRRWLDRFGSDEVAAHTYLALTAAWCALDNGRAVDRWVEAASHGVFDATDPGAVDEVAAAMALLHAHLARGGLSAMARDAQQALDLQGPDDPWRAYASYLLAVGVLLQGSPESAQPMFEEAGRLAGALEMPAHRALCLAQLAAIAIEAGRWDDAERDSGTATRLVAGIGSSETPTLSIVRCVGAMVLAHEGQGDAGRQETRRAMRLVAVPHQCPPWLAVQTRYLLGRSNILIGDAPAARILLSEAQSHMRGTTDATWLRERLDNAWSQVESFPLATGVGPSALTTAELRVLHLLPSHLSFEEIGKRLNVSRNTVKTQAIAAYRKLGVSSRSEAVARATAVGMIQV